MIRSANLLTRPQTVNGLLETKPQTSKALLIITQTVSYLSGSSDSDSSGVNLPGSILEISAESKRSHLIAPCLSSAKYNTEYMRHHIKFDG